MATWYCTQCGGSNVSSVQPSADASGNYMTGLCLACPKYATDRSGVVIQTGRVIVSGKDVSGGAFTAATEEGGERLTSAAGATLRRYVRYVATRTGGSAGQGITFALATGGDAWHTQPAQGQGQGPDEPVGA